MNLEYLGMIKFGISAFCIGVGLKLDDVKKNNRSVVILGTGYNAHWLSQYLIGKGIEVIAYADNFNRFWGRTYLGKPVVRPKDIFKRKDIHIIIAVANEDVRIARMQLFNYGIEGYSIFFTTGFHSFEYENERLNERLLEAINMIVFAGEEELSVLPRNKIVLRQNGGGIWKT